MNDTVTFHYQEGTKQVQALKYIYNLFITYGTEIYYIVYKHIF